jgi:ubiquinone/menaquinone biosynthesis C-methylase UbiE
MASLMRPAPTGFDRVAGVYRWLETIALGRTLQRAREAHLPHLRAAREVLVIGDGDGRGLAALVRAAPHARVTSVDASPRMLGLARQRVRAAGASSRVSFVCADARLLAWPPCRYDAIVTMFVLDCFTDEDVARLVASLGRSLRPGGVWLFADFALPTRGWRRWHARLWVSGLYAFFRWRTGIAARTLPSSEAWLTAQGLRAEAVTAYRAGLIRSVAYRQPDPAAHGELGGRTHSGV